MHDHESAVRVAAVGGNVLVRSHSHQYCGFLQHWKKQWMRTVKRLSSRDDADEDEFGVHTYCIYYAAAAAAVAVLEIEMLAGSNGCCSRSGCHHAELWDLYRVDSLLFFVVCYSSRKAKAGPVRDWDVLVTGYPETPRN